LDAQDYVGSASSAIFSLDCFLTESHWSPFYVKSVVFLFLPLLLLVLPAVVFTIYSFCHLRSLRLSLLRNVSATPTDYIQARQVFLHDLKSLYRTGEVVVLFLIHPDLTLQAFGIFACKQIGITEDSYYLLADMSRQCYTSTHYFWILLIAFPMLLLWVIGVPLAAFIIARRRMSREMTILTVRAIRHKRESMISIMSQTGHNSRAASLMGEHKFDNYEGPLVLPRHQHTNTNLSMGSMSHTGHLSIDSHPGTTTSTPPSTTGSSPIGNHGLLTRMLTSLKALGSNRSVAAAAATIANDGKAASSNDLTKLSEQEVKRIRERAKRDAHIILAKSSLGLLFRGYTTQWWWWEFLVIARKVFLHTNHTPYLPTTLLGYVL
jgi:hypothetical protein